MSVSFRTVVASAARHRFGIGPRIALRKRRRRCALPAHSKIPAAPPEKQKAVERLVDRILAAKARDAGADVSALEREIASQPRKVFPKPLTVAVATGGDELVYALYDLTPEEIQIVEGSSK